MTTDTASRPITEVPAETLAWFGGDDLRARVFFDKYALRGSDGVTRLESTPLELWHRVARAIASAEETPELQATWEKNFYWLMEDFRFVPGGRILHGAGKSEALEQLAGERNAVTVLNCYVIPFRDKEKGVDSIEAVYRLKKEMAKTYAYGGGVGIDISAMRYRGAKVHNASRTATGAASFMDEFSLTTGTIGQDGRRGALMITIADWHPDVLEFAVIKSQLNRWNRSALEQRKHLFRPEDLPRIEELMASQQVRFANVSIRLSDAFMQAVEADGNWGLRFPDYERAGMATYIRDWTGDLADWAAKGHSVEVVQTIRARELWDLLIEGAHRSAEPGLVMWDTTKRFSTSEYNRMNVVTTNPCSEIPLEPYGACDLGNLNLSEFVTAPFSQEARVDWDVFETALRYATRFLDNVLTYNAEKHPLRAQTEASLKSRRIGVGFTGLGDMLIKLGMKYDSEEAVRFVDTLFERVKLIVFDESVNLAIEKGPFPAYDSTQHFFTPDRQARAFYQTFPVDLIERARRYGLRNVALLTVPPVGSGAALAGVTSGIEPIFDLSYVRRSESLSQDTFKVYHPAVRQYMNQAGIDREEDLPPYFVTAHTTKPEMRVLMQAAVQRHIDHSISSTINLPADISVEAVGQIYLQAWKEGLKGVTVYREGSREGILITAEQAKKQGLNADGASPPTQMAVQPSPRPRPKVTTGRTERIETPRGRIYVLTNWDDVGVCEVFVHSFDVEAESIGRLASLSLRAGVDPREVIEQLWRVQSKEIALDRSSDRTVVRISTIAQAVALGLGRALYGENFHPDKEFPHASRLPDPMQQGTQERLFNGKAPSASVPAEVSTNHVVREKALPEFIGICPDCGEPLIHQSGCASCRSCGFTKC